MAGWIRRVTTVLVVIAAVWVLLIALLWLGQRRLIYLPDRTLPAPPGNVSVVTTRTDDGVAHRLWVVPAEGAPRARVVVFNGNAGNKAHRLPLAGHLAAEGFEVVLFDYRGYGDTPGSPSEEGLFHDARAAATATFEPDLPKVYFGESIGAAVATRLSLEVRPEALVLRSPFTSLADMAGLHYPVVPAGLLLRDRFPVAETIGQVDIPVLVVLGTGDSIVPPRMSRDVHDAAGDPKELVELEGYGHNDPGLTHGKELTGAVARFWHGMTD